MLFASPMMRNCSVKSRAKRDARRRFALGLRRSVFATIILTIATASICAAQTPTGTSESTAAAQGGAPLSPGASSQSKAQTESSLASGYSQLRSEEDWSFLRDGRTSPDIFDPVKYIPLNRAADLLR